MTMDLKEFGIYFAGLRERSGYRSQRELADKSGVSHSTINRIESGTHKASPETLKSLSMFLFNVDYNDLLKAAGYLDNQSKDNNDKNGKEEASHSSNETNPKILRMISRAKELSELSEDELDQAVDYIEFLFQQAKKKKKRD